METLQELKSAHVLSHMLDTLDTLTSESRIREKIAQISDLLFHGQISDTDAGTAFKVLEAFRSVCAKKTTVAQRIPDQARIWKEEGRSGFQPHIRKRMPSDKKAEYMARRRDLAGGGFLPKQILRHFTIGQQAALAVISQEVGKNGACTLVIEKIAALAGVCHATVRRAVARAKSSEFGFLTVEYRERRGKPSLSNVIRIVSSTWLDWIKRRFSVEKIANKVRKSASLMRRTLFLTKADQKCNPTPYTNNIKGSRLHADYSISKKTRDTNEPYHPICRE